MSGSLCTSACGYCGRCNAPEEEDPEPVEPLPENEDDCPNCGEHVKGKWAIVVEAPASWSSPEETGPRCFRCAGSSKRIREQLWDAFDQANGPVAFTEN